LLFFQPILLETNNTLANKPKKMSFSIPEGSCDELTSLLDNSHKGDNSYLDNNNHNASSWEPLDNNSATAEGGGTPANTNDKVTTGISAGLYVISGMCQPLIMTLCKNAGLADRTCQLYMLFYYLGPCSVGLRMWYDRQEALPSTSMIVRAGGITLFDITAQAMNYTGAALAGPTIFAIVYSSVTVWTAVFSRLVLQRRLWVGQWLGVFIVFGGLALTATDNSVQVGSDVAHGLVLVVFGSAMHGFTYVLCEVVMVVREDAAFLNSSSNRFMQWIIGDKQERRMSVVQNCAIQGFFAMSFMLLWQLVYTLPHYTELIQEPMQEAGTTAYQAGIISRSLFACQFGPCSVLLLHSQTLSRWSDQCWCHEGIASGLGFRGNTLLLLWTNWGHGNVLFTHQVCIARDCCGWCGTVWNLYRTTTSTTSSAKKTARRSRSEK
jgi:drug/metabolite transporter (DMT)-like permease